MSSPQPLPKSSLVSVVGCGTMGAGIAQVAAAAGHPVLLFDARAEAIPQAIQNIRKTFEKLAAREKMTAKDAGEAAARLAGASSVAELSKSALVIEAIAEDLLVKQNLFGQLERVVAGDCILATNTSSLSITEMASGLQVPERVIGMHFFNPAPLMALVEIVSGFQTGPKYAATIHATAASWGKKPVYVKSTPGFIVNRVARPYYGEALLLLAEQSSAPATIDAVMRESMGFRMGPFELMDLIGLDVNFAVTRSVFEACFNDPRYKPSLIQQEMIRAGKCGRKTMRGFYQYGDSLPAPDIETEQGRPAPQRVSLPASNPLTGALTHRLRDTGVAVQSVTAEAGSANWIEVEGASIAITDGRSATQRAQEMSQPNVVLVDLALDYSKAARLAVAKASHCDSAAYDAAVGLLQAAGFAVSRVKDTPGLVAMRTIAMLANEAADLVNQGIATASDIDMAMQAGVNYPKGPLAWADDLGIETICRVLQSLAENYGGEHYRISPELRQRRWSGERFFLAVS